jgi:hypothetical protein
MKKAITLLIAITIMSSSCQESKQVVSLPEADIVYQTIIDHKDVLGFFSLENNESSFVNIQMPLQFPFDLNPDQLIGNIKRGNLGVVKDYTGNLTILTKQRLNDICVNKNIGGSRIQSVGWASAHHQSMYIINHAELSSHPCPGWDIFLHSGHE